MPQRMIFHGTDEVEAVRLFETGRIDYAQLVSEELMLGASGEVRTHPVVEDEGLVIRWAGGQYITREDGSPLMDALRLWVENAPREPSRAISEPPSFMREQPELRMDDREEEPVISADEQEPVSSGSEERGGKRAESVPPEPHRKPTSSSWVRWWNRSRDITEADRPVLRVSNTIPLESVSFCKYGKYDCSRCVSRNCRDLFLPLVVLRNFLLLHQPLLAHPKAAKLQASSH
jgi:phosphatidate phosphatase LPIN